MILWFAERSERDDRRRGKPLEENGISGRQAPATQPRVCNEEPVERIACP